MLQPLTKMIAQDSLPSRASAVERLDPDEIRELLARDPEASARANEASVAKYAEMMRSGGWINNGEAIIIDRDGGIVDGVQRLTAALRADYTFEAIPVIRDVSADTIHVVDQHARRSFASVLQVRGYSDSGAIVTTAANMIRFDNGQFGLEHIRIDWPRYDRVLDRNPELVTGIELGRSYQSSVIKPAARYMLAIQALKAGHEKQAEDLFRLTSKEDNRISMSHPAAVLYSMLEGQRGKEMTKHEHLALATMALNEMIEGREEIASRFKFTAKVGKRKFPLGQFPDRATARREWDDKTWNAGVPAVTGYEGLEGARYDDVLQNSREVQIALDLTLTKDKEPDTEIKLHRLRITPEQAQDWLTHNNKRNRKVIEPHAQMIRRDIEAGRWMNSAQPIVFDQYGMILNGQHRLRACALADIPIETYVVTGVDPQAFSTYDSHSRREMTFEARNLRITDRTAVKAAARLLQRVEMGMQPWAKMSKRSTGELREVIERHPELGEFAVRYRDVFQISHGVATFMGYHTYQEDPRLGPIFMSWLEDASNIPPGNPFSKTRDKLMKLREDLRGGTGQRDVVLRFLMQAWDDFKKREAGNADALEHYARRLREIEQEAASVAARGSTDQGGLFDDG